MVVMGDIHEVGTGYGGIGWRMAEGIMAIVQLWLTTWTPN